MSNPLTIHARKTTATPTPTPFTDMFFDDVKTLYDLDQPQTHAIHVEQIYSDFRKGDKPPIDLLELRAADRSHRHRSRHGEAARRRRRRGNATVVKLDVPIVDDKQSAHLKVTGTLDDAGLQDLE